MNISWRRRELVGNRWPPIDEFALRLRPRSTLEAILGRSERVDGKPKRFHIAALGHIDETAIDHPAHRYAFWLPARARLNELDLTDSIRADLTTKLAERIEPIDESAFVEQAPWLGLFLVDPDAAEAVMQVLYRGGVIDDSEHLFRVEYVASFIKARQLHRAYQEALDLAQAMRRQARDLALAAS